MRYLVNRSTGELKEENAAVSLDIIAPEEETAVASRAYAEGEQFILKGKLYAATAAIASGASIVTEGAGANAEEAPNVIKQIEDHICDEGTGTDSRAEGINSMNVASGDYSHAEGWQVSASGDSSHAEGSETSASGPGSHAEGSGTSAYGANSHAEGSGTSAYGANSHAEGSNTSASEIASHAEGGATIASAPYSHAEGWQVSASGDSSHAEGGATIASGANSHAEGGATIASAPYSHAEGSSTSASGANSHAEGQSTKAYGANSHAEGGATIASGDYSHAEGSSTTASGANSHAEGQSTKVSGDYSHAEGYFTRAVVGEKSHAEGSYTTAIGNCSHAEGGATIASGANSHAEGAVTTASGLGSHSEGCYTYAVADYQHVGGVHNKVYSGSSGTGGALLIMGKGSAYTARANCFRVTTANIYATAAYSSSGADYAEMFEWEDQNPDKEDRAGYFVTITDDKIKIANSEDDFILGIVSGNPSCIGDVYDDQWNDMFETDIFGRPVYETYFNPDTLKYDTREKLNPAFDPTKEYIPRSARPEWDAVGLVGKLIALDDGTAEVNGWVKPNANGIATASATATKFRVMKRLDESHIQILIL